MPRRALAIMSASIIALTASAATPAVAAPGHQSAVLAGTWQVKTTCTAICKGTTTLTEKVSLRGNNVYSADGSAQFMLYLLSKQVLVHSRDTTMLLTIKTPGVLMTGLGVNSDSSTYSSTWQCKASTTAQAYLRGSAPRARVMC